MKFFAAFTLLVAAGVTAQDKNCEAEYIVTRCLKTETDKVRPLCMFCSLLFF